MNATSATKLSTEPQIPSNLSFLFIFSLLWFLAPPIFYLACVWAFSLIVRQRFQKAASPYVFNTALHITETHAIYWLHD